MSIVRFGARAARKVSLLVLAWGCLAGQPPVGRAAAPRPVVPAGPTNKDWDVDASSATFTGGGHGPITIRLVLDKGAVCGRTVSVQSDGDHLALSDDADPAAVAVLMAVVPRPDAAAADAADGVVSTLQLIGGDHPSIAFDGHESVRENGHWRRIARDPGPTMTLSVVNATFAIVKFPPPAPPPTPVAVAPAPAVRAPPVAVAPAPPRLKPGRLQALSRAFADAVSKRCPTCRGTGWVVRQVQVGSQKQGIFYVPVMQNVTQACGRCEHGELHGTPEQVLRQTANLVRGLIDVDRADPNAQAALKDTYDVVTENAIGDYRAWGLLTKDARSTLSLANPRAGTALIAEVFVDQAWTDAAGRRMFRAHLPGTTNAFVIQDPPTADNVQIGPALMGGLIDHSDPAPPAPAGADAPPTADDPPPPSSTAVRGAFLIAPNIDRRWTWWIYRDAYRAHD